MVKYKIFLILMVLVFVVGQSCDLNRLRGGGSDSIDADEFTGTKGLVLEFIDGLPPDVVWKGVNFGVWLDVHNQGVDDVKSGRACIGSLPQTIFTKADSCVDLKTISGRRNFPGGEIQIYGEKVWEEFRIKDNYQVNVDTRYPIIAKTCYEYSTSLAPLVCIRDVQMDEREAVCDAGDISVSGSQGAPVAVSSLREEIVPRGEENELLFTIVVENDGDGEVIKSGVKDDKCNFERKEKKIVNVEVELPGFGKAKCKNEGKIILISGKGQAFCSGIKVPKGESFSLPLNIKLTYGYLSRIRSEFTIKKDIVEVT